MDAEIRYHACEVRAEGRVLTGTAMPYGSEADIAGVFRERFEPRAFGDVAELDVLLNASHDRAAPLARTGGGGLELNDSPQALTFRATLPATARADEVLELVRSRVMRGASVEFHATKERDENGVRVIERATLSAIAVVDRPAYADASVAARWLERRPSPRARRKVYL